MKKLFICILVGLLSLTTFNISAQSHKPSQFELLATTHGDIRNTLNDALDAIFDTTYIHRALFTSLINALDVRLTAIENLPAVDQIRIFGVPAAYQIPVFYNGSDSTLTASDLYYKNTFFGVGVSNPLAKIHLDGGNATATYTKYTAGTTTSLGVNDGFDVGIDGTGKGKVINNENLDVDLGTNGTVFLTITPTTFDIKTDVKYNNVVPLGVHAYSYLSADQIQRWDSSYVLSSKVLTTDLMPLKDLLADKNKEGEIRWPSINNNGDVRWGYRTRDMKMGEMLSADQGMIEASLRYTRALEKKIVDLEERLSEESKTREDLEKRVNQIEKEQSRIKHKLRKREERTSDISYTIKADPTIK